MDEVFQVGFSSLTRGQLYPIKHIEKTESTFNGRRSPGIKVTILDDGLEMVTYLPSKLVKSLTNERISEILAAGLTDKKQTVCYYGKMKKDLITEFYGRVHLPNEGRCDKLFNDLTKIMAKYSNEPTPEKRKHEDDGENSSPKVAKADN